MRTISRVYYRAGVVVLRAVNNVLWAIYWWLEARDR